MVFWSSGLHCPPPGNPEMYTDAKHAEDTEWTLKEDDNMPICQEMHGSDRQGHAYWSGYFSTRAALKRNVVEGSGFLQAARQLQLFARQPLRFHLDNRTMLARTYGAAHWSKDVLASDLLPLEMAVGLGTHHDGMTGTCKQHVSDDYTLRLATSYTLAEEVAATALVELLNLPAGTKLASCRLINETKCAFTDDLTTSSSFGAVVYNPLALNRSELIRIPVPSKKGYQVYSAVDGKLIPTAAVVTAPPLGKAQYINADRPYGKMLPYELQFVVELPALGLSTFEVRQSADATHGATVKSQREEMQPSQVPTIPAQQEPVTIENERFLLSFGVSLHRTRMQHASNY
jgi:alpha-mannosidase